MNTDAPRPIRPADPGSRGRRGDALGSVLGRPRDPRGRATRPHGGRVRRPVAAKTWPETSSVCIRGIYFGRHGSQTLNERLSLDSKAAWSGGVEPIIGHKERKERRRRGNPSMALHSIASGTNKKSNYRSSSPAMTFIAPKMARESAMRPPRTCSSKLLKMGKQGGRTWMR